MAKQMKFLQDKVADIFKAFDDIVSDDVTRTLLNHVQVRRDGKNVRLTATDGHFLLTVLVKDQDIAAALTDGMPTEHEGKPLLDAYVRPREAMQRALARVPLAHALADDVIDVYSFPAWEQVIPEKKTSKDRHAALCGFNPDIMATLCRVMRRAMTALGAGKNYGVTMTASKDGLSPMRFDASGHEYEMTGVLMPMRV